jgi:hypothetical protein
MRELSKAAGAVRTSVRLIVIAHQLVYEPGFKAALLLMLEYEFKRK